MATQRIHEQGSIASLRKVVPVRKLSTRYTTKPPSRLPEFEMIKPPSQAENVVISIEEKSAPGAEESQEPSMDKGKQPDIRMTKGRPQPPPLTIPRKAQLPPPRVEVPPPRLPPPPSPPPDRAPSAAAVPLPKSATDTPTPAETPVMRSMFPTYNPQVPLSQQQYRPNESNVPEATNTMMANGLSSNNPYRNQYNSSRTSLPSNPTAPENRETPLRRSGSLKREVTVSTAEQLQDLWDVANGQGYDAVAESYVLELNCDDLTPDREIINFSAPSVNVYTLAASSSPASTIRVSRAHPVHTGTRIAISTSTMAIPSRQDPLVCCIFPKLAGLMALDRSSTEAVEKGLNRAASNLLQKQAVEDAQDREASMLLWDADSGRYCILHPNLLDDAATTLPIEISPSPSAPQQITIVAPETHAPLLSLDMQSLAVTVHAQAITALPSLYILDTLMVALLTLLLHLHRLCALPRHSPSASPEDDDASAVPYFPPPPGSMCGSTTRSHRSTSKQNKRNRSRSRSRRTTFFRSNTNATTRSARSAAPPYSSDDPTWPTNHQGQDKDVELGVLSPDGTSISTNSVAAAKRKQKQKPPKGLFSEFINDENLPSGTRTVLRFLYWIFEVIYWVLGLAVHLMVAGVVAGGKLVTKL